MKKNDQLDDITIGLIIKTSSEHIDDIIRFFKADPECFLVYFKSSRKRLILSETEGV